MSAMYPGSSHCVPAGLSTCVNWRDTNTTFGAGQHGVGRRAIGELHEVLREFERELSVIGILTGEVGSHRVTPRQHMDRERSLGLMAQLPNALEVSAKQYCGKRYEIDT